MCIASIFAYQIVTDANTERIDRICNDTIHKKIVVYDTTRSYPISQSQTSKRIYTKISTTKVLEEDAITFDYLYDCHKTPGCAEISSKIPYDTTIKWLSRNKDTVFYLTLRK